MTMPAPRPRGTREALAAREFAITRVARPSPIAIVWRWRYELLIAITVPVIVYGFVRSAGPVWTILLIAGMAAPVAISPPARRLFIAYAWCVITPHRVRAGMAQAWIHSRDGRIPVVLWTTRQPFGERVHLWCRAGTCAEDFVWARHLLASACWASGVRVMRNERHAHLVALDVIRRIESSRGFADSGRMPGSDVGRPEWPGTVDMNQRWPWSEVRGGGTRY